MTFELYIPYNNIKIARILGAKWNANRKTWECENGNTDLINFSNMCIKERDKNREYIFVNYNQREDAKKLGAKWESYEKSWYVDKNNLEAIEKYGKKL